VPGDHIAHEHGRAEQCGIHRERIVVHAHRARIAPFSVGPRPRLRLGFDDAYEDNPWWWVCDSWPVGSADPTVAAPPASDVPTLVALGRFAPYSPEPATRRALAGLTAASYVTDPERPHNVLPRPCAAGVRNRWTDKPEPFTDNPCPKESEISWT